MSMDAVVLGFDTSCYTTSVAAVELSGRPVASCRQLLPVPLGERGLRQSDAVFIHVRQLPALVEELSRIIKGRTIAAVCASTQPREDEKSYMPVFQAGDAQARGIAALLGIPCFASNHQRGHIEAALVDAGMSEDPLLAVHLSGGTTELLAYDGAHVTLLGGTLDLHAGQVVDRTGVALGLPFPAGPRLEELARRGTAQARLPVSMERDGLHCHLSGAETQLQRWIQAGALPAEDIAREVYDLLARTVARLVAAGARETGIRQVLLAGGVASSALFREMVTARMAKLDRQIRLHFGHPEYSGDNAVGAARIGAKLLREGASPRSLAHQEEGADL